MSLRQSRFKLELAIVLCLSTQLMSYSVQRGFECNPAEEGKPHNISLYLTKESYASLNELFFERDNKLLGSCRDDLDCSSMDPQNYSFKAFLFKKSAQVVMTIHNVTRSALATNEYHIGKSEKLSIRNDEYVCLLKVYSKIHDMICTYYVHDNDFWLKCESKRVYPKALCRYFVSFNKMLMEFYYVASYDHLEMSLLPTYYHSTCILQIPNTHLRAGLYDLNVTMFPNVTGDRLDALYGTHRNYSFSLENPSVMLNECPQHVKVDTLVVCECHSWDSDLLNSTASWYDVNGNIVGGTSVLTFYPVNYQIPVYSCISTNMIGWKSPVLRYEPNILYPPNITSFTLNGVTGEEFSVVKNTIILLICKGNGFPKPELKLFNGPILLQQNLALHGELQWSQTMTCETFNTFTCSALQENTTLQKNMTIHSECSLQLKYPHSNMTAMEVSENETVSIVIDVYGYPRPSNYTLIKNGSASINLDSGLDGEAKKCRYSVVYVEGMSPYGTVNLTIYVLGIDDITDYMFVIGNNERENLNYFFSLRSENYAAPPVSTSTTVLRMPMIILFSVLAILIALILLITSFARRGAKTRKVSLTKTEMENVETFGHGRQELATDGYITVIDRASDDSNINQDISHPLDDSHHYETINSESTTSSDSIKADDLDNGSE